MNSLSFDRYQNIMLFLILLITSFFVFFHIDNQSVWLDEAFSVAVADLNWRNFFHLLSFREANHGFYYILLKVWLPLGKSEFAIRELSAVFAIASVPVFYSLGSRLFNTRAGLIAALFLSVNAFFIEFAQEARGYSLLLLLVVASTYYFIKTIDQSCWINKLGYVIMSTLALYTHFFAALVLIAHGFSVLFLPKKYLRWKDVLQCSFGIVFLCFPLAVYVFLKRNLDTVGWISGPTLKDIYYLFMALTGNDGRANLLVYFIPCFIFLANGIRSWMESKKSMDTWRYIFLLSWLFVPIICAYMLSKHKPVFVYKYLIVSLPALVLIAGIGAANIKNRYIPIILVILLVSLSIRAIVTSYYPKEKENWREATNYILTHANSGDAILFYAPYIKQPFEYYRKKKNAHPDILHCIYPSPLGDDPETLFPDFYPDRNLFNEKYKRIWIVLSHDNIPKIHQKSQYMSKSLEVYNEIINSIENNYQIKERENFNSIKIILFMKNN